LISSPETFDPFNHPREATQRRAHVLRRMASLGHISPQDVEAASAQPLPTTLHVRRAQPTRYFTEEVRRQLLADERLGPTPDERRATVFRGGIRVETTFDPRVQAAAEAAVREILPASPFTAALVAVDPSDGSVKALVGGPGFEQAKYNLATQGARQAGSSFKTVALAAWLADGRSPEDVVDATAPCELPMPAPQPPWKVDNYDGGSGEPIVSSLREATVRSSNCAYARLSLVLGHEKIAAMARDLGIRRELPPYPSIVLGSGEVSPLEMASVYATLAAEGVRREPMFIRRVLDRQGKVLFENSPREKRVLDANVARTVTDVLRGVVDRGTGTRAAIGRPAAGKTGTAQEWRDAWFAGYTPQLASAVWMGSPVGQHPMVGVEGVNVTGGSYPARIWSRFMSAALAPLPVADFAAPNAAAWPAPAPIGALPLSIVPPPPSDPAPAIVPPAPIDERVREWRDRAKKRRGD
ncbi:MAG TPA: penicillin-binding transpeptidase domain-containing protein, partial [Acidimicrobiales bacterium]|nr:penicillin-binding transpeptidase domain-containing protein [Acidimicrobiales bacterium]